MKKVLKEEFLRGVPEFVLREAVHKYVQDVGQQIKRHITMTHGESGPQRTAIDVANEVLKELEDETYELLEQKIWQYLQHT